MFNVNRYDPREDDRREEQRKIVEEKKHKKKKKKSKRQRHDEDTEEEVFRKEISSSKEKKNRKKSKKAEESGDNEQQKQEQQSKGGILGKAEQQIENTWKVIAPETDGAISSERKFNTKISEEAFDDLDIMDEDDNQEEEDDSKKAKPLSKTDDKATGDDFDPTDEIQRALYMSQKPIQVAAKAWGLADFLVENVKSTEGFDEFFPIQSLVIPDVIVAERHAHVFQQSRDICVAAPTGSGKTLAFVLPVLQALSKRKVCRLRALVVLPSRDLAKQVYSVFDQFKEGSNLKIGLAIGQSDFHAEQEYFQVGDLDSEANVQLKFALNPGNFPLAVKAMEDQMYNATVSSNSTEYTPPRGGISNIDVLVCTPGRLVDHLDNTPGFTLQHLRFLVIDEADRLLSQPYHGWIARVLESAGNTTNMKQVLEHSNTKMQPLNNGLSNSIDPITWRGSEITHQNNCYARPLQLRKLLYSATLTKDPQKLASLQLVNPKFFDAHHLTSKSTSKSKKTKNSLYSMPELLQEYTVECTAEQKPLVLLALLLERIQHSNTNKIIVIFTSSLESTHRLARLLQLLWIAGNYGDRMPKEFSSSLNQNQRSALMKEWKGESATRVGQHNIIVCSDGMSRGMDLPSVSTVINYDVPGFAKTYVHRCGRTARAGNSGDAITLLKGSGQMGQFQKLRRLIEHPDRVEPATVPIKLVRPALKLYKTCVQQLRQLIAAEERGALHPVDTNFDECLH